MSESRKSEYTAEQVTLVQRIRKCKNYYEILGVTSESSDAEIKKNYKKLALQLHPDKNKAPDATEAFKKVSNAFMVLADSEKKKRYDAGGQNEEVVQERPHPQTFRGFDDRVAEELFNTFFGGGLNFGNARNGQAFHTFHRTYTANNHRERNENRSAVLMQLLPILLLIVISMFSSLFVSEPHYSLIMNSKYSVPMQTSRLGVPYYVKNTFKDDYTSSIPRLERSVEEEYMSVLQKNCYQESNYKQAYLWRARQLGDNEMYKRGVNMKTESCKKYEQLAGYY